MKTLKKAFLIALLIYTVPLFQGKLVHAVEYCPEFYSSSNWRRNSEIRTNDIYNSSANENQSSVGDTFTVTGIDGNQHSGSIGFNIGPRSIAFSDMFLNFYNILAPYTTNTSSPQGKDEEWKTFCINPNDVNTESKLNITTSASITYTYTVKNTVDCVYGIDGTLDPSMNQRPDGTCYEEDSGTDTKAAQPKDHDISFQIPYTASIREIARKLPPIISSELEYCTTGSSNTCKFAYTCQQIPATLRNEYPNLPAGNDGVCVFDNANQTTDYPFPANILCQESDTFKPQEELTSKICYDKGNGHKVSGFPIENSVHDNSYVSSGNISPATNTIPWDIEAMDKYYGAAFYEKLGLYTSDEATWIRNLPARISVRFGLSGDTVRKSPENQVFFNDDFVDKLGGYIELGNDTRHMNPNLIPTGDDVYYGGGHQVYLRGGSQKSGAVFVDGHPLKVVTAPGKTALLPSLNGDNSVGANSGPMRLPRISNIGPGGKFLVSASASDQDRKGIYIAESNGTEMGPLINIGPGEYFFGGAPFINTQGEKIVFAFVNGKYQYKTTRTSFIPNSTGWKPVPNNIQWYAQFSIDGNDRVHIGWIDSSERVIHYTRLNVSDISSVKVEIANETIPLGGSPEGISGAQKFSLNSDEFGNVMVVSSVADGPDNFKLNYNERDANGGWGTPVTIMRRGSDTLDTKLFILSDTNGFHVARQYDFTKQNYRTMVVFLEMTADKEDAPLKYQIKYKQSIGKNSWTPQNITEAAPLTDVLSQNWQNGAYGEKVSSEGIAAITLDERVSKYDPVTKLFDPGEIKRCVIPIPGDSSGSTECGKSSGGIGFVVPPTQNNGKLLIINPENNQIIYGSR